MEHDTELPEGELASELVPEQVPEPEPESELEPEPGSAPEPEPSPVAAAPEAMPPTQTGDARVDAAIAPLGELDELPVSEHPPLFERVHGQLVEVLGELHAGAGSAGIAEPGESP